MGPGSALFGPPSARGASRARTGEHRWLMMAGLVTTAVLVAASAFVLHRAHHERRKWGGIVETLGRHAPGTLCWSSRSARN
jgi:hypothetical protein